MKIEEVKRKDRDQSKKIVMTIRTTPEISRWMKKNDVSPTKLFDSAVNELIESGK